LNGEAPVLRSDGQYVRDYIYVEDVVDAYLALASGCERDGVKGEAFNFSPESRVTVIEITRLIQQLMGRTDLEPIILNRASAEIRDQYLDSSRAQQRLGWRPRFALQDGLKATIAWYADYLAVQPA